MDVFGTISAKKLKSVGCYAAVVVLLSSQIVNLTIAAQIGHKTPKDSFLSLQVTSVDGLIHEISTSPKIRARYARLYKLPSLKVLDYMRKNLVLSKLAHKYVDAVYCVTPTGVIFTAQETLNAGDKVFALRNGVPVLRWVCGNPLTDSLPQDSRVTVLANNVLFTGIKVVRPHAALHAIASHRAKNHGKPIQAALNKAAFSHAGAQLASKVVQSIVSPKAPPVLSRPTEIYVAVTSAPPPHVPLAPFLLGLPLAFFGDDGFDGGSNGSDSSGEDKLVVVPISVPGTGDVVSGSDTLQHALTPEPAPIVTVLLAGLLLAFGIHAARRRSKTHVKDQVS
jgi:hypothetical protein